MSPDSTIKKSIIVLLIVFLLVMPLCHITGLDLIFENGTVRIGNLMKPVRFSDKIALLTPRPEDLAERIRRLSEAGARVIVLDSLSFKQGDRAAEEELLNAVRQARTRGSAVVLGIEDFRGDQPEMADDDKQAFSGYGLACVRVETQSRILMPAAVIRNGKPLYSLSLMALEHYKREENLHIKDERLIIKDGDRVIREFGFESVRDIRPKCESLRQGDHVVKIMIDPSYVGKLRDSEQWCVDLEDPEFVESVSSKIVLIGEWDDVVLHACAVNMILNHAYIKPAPLWFSLGYILFAAILSAAFVRYKKRIRIRVVAGIFISFLFCFPILLYYFADILMNMLVYGILTFLLIACWPDTKRREESSPDQTDPQIEENPPINGRALSKANAEVYISYSVHDRCQVLKITRHLINKGISVWADHAFTDNAPLRPDEVMHAITTCKVVLLMCSEASIRSLRVKQEIQLACKFEKFLLPLILQQINFPPQIEFFLADCVFIEVLDHHEDQWLPQCIQMLKSVSDRVPDTLPPAEPLRLPPTEPARLSPEKSFRLPPEEPLTEPVQLNWSLENIWILGAYTDQVWATTPAERADRGVMRSELRNIGVSQENARQNDRVRINIESEIEGYRLLLNKGPEGTIYCLSSSHFTHGIRLPSGQRVLSQKNPAECDDSFKAISRPRLELLTAIITREPLDFDWIPSDPETPAHALSSSDIQELLERLRSLGKDQWVVLSTYFEVGEEA